MLLWLSKEILLLLLCVEQTVTDVSRHVVLSDFRSMYTAVSCGHEWRFRHLFLFRRFWLSLRLNRFTNHLLLSLNQNTNFMEQSSFLPITVAAWSKEWTLFNRSNAGVVGSNPTQGMDVSICLFCVVVFCVKAAALRHAVPLSKESCLMCVGLRNWKKRPRSSIRM
jgi:hypothetical protein